MYDFAAGLVDRVAAHVPVRQWVLTVPHGLRVKARVLVPAGVFDHSWRFAAGITTEPPGISTPQDQGERQRSAVARCVGEAREISELRPLDAQTHSRGCAGRRGTRRRGPVADTILGCFRLAGVDPAAYLTDVLPRLARRIHVADVGALMPARWKTRRLAAAPTPGLTAASEAPQPTHAILTAQVKRCATPFGLRSGGRTLARRCTRAQGRETSTS
jgi:hypothetical protein